MLRTSDELFVPLTQQPSVSYWRLSDFKSKGGNGVNEFYVSMSWMMNFGGAQNGILFFLAACTNLQMLPSARKDVKNFTSGFEMYGGDVTMMVVFVWHSIWTIVLHFLSC